MSIINIVQQFTSQEAVMSNNGKIDSNEILPGLKKEEESGLNNFSRFLLEFFLLFKTFTHHMCLFLDEYEV